MGLPLWLVPGGAPGWFRGAAVLLPRAEQGKEEMPSGFARSHPSQQGCTAMEGAEVNRSELIHNISHGFLNKHPRDLPQKVEKAQVRSASPNQGASLPTSRVYNDPYPTLRHVHLSPTYPTET